MSVLNSIEKDVVFMYKSGKTSKEIGSVFGVCRQYVDKILHKNNVDMRRTGNERKYTLDTNSFKSIDTDESAYWLGFLYADGYTRKNRYFSVGLQTGDYNHLEKLKIFLKTNQPIEYRTNNIGSKYCRLQINCSEISKNLYNLGITPRRKNIELTLSSLDQNKIHHFLRGLFDGDGDLSLNKQVRFSGRFDIMNWTNKTICNTLNLKEKKICDGNGAYRVSFSGRIQGIKVLDYMYNDSSIYLDRKHRIYDQWQR